MSNDEPQFLVNPYDDPVILRVRGKASFLNSAPVKELLDELVNRQQKSRFVIDFSECTGMDSTFLGILAGLGISMMKREPKGSVVVCNLGERNLELIENLGLHRLLTVDSGDVEIPESEMQGLRKGEALTDIENARLVLNAHKNLAEADSSNKAKFQDVIAFLKNQIEGN